MGMSHRATLARRATLRPSDQLLLVAAIILLACVIILATPHSLRAETVAPEAPTASLASAPAKPAEQKSWHLGGDKPNADLGSTSGRASRAFMYIAAVLILGAGVVSKYGKKKNSAPNTEIEVVARKSISPKHALLIVTVEGERLLLAQTTEQLSLVTKLSTCGFSRELAQFMDAELERDAAAEIRERQQHARSERTGNV